MKKITLLAAAAFSFFLNEKGASQTVWPTCGHDAVLQNELSEDPDFEQKQTDFEAFYLEKMTHLDAANGARTVVTVPVVFHIIHQNGSENLSNAQILVALEHLNWAFSNTGGYVGGLGTDVEIRFCLATQKPDGTASTGIERVASPLTDLNYPAGDPVLKNLSRYDPTRYVNIWVVKSICFGPDCGIAGYAFLPTSHGTSKDGIVMEASFVGVSTASSAGLAHEMGHYFGLRHTFAGGCGNGNCLTSGDGICDTPPDNSTSWAPCGGPWPNTCTTDVGLNSPFLTDQNDMISNFMDYGDWSCFHDFTVGQAARMQFSLQNARKSLLESNGCQPPCLTSVTAFFTAPATATLGQTLFFQSQTTGATVFEWKINGQTVSTAASFSHTFSTAGLFEIELKATEPTGCATVFFSQKIEVTCPTIAAFLAAVPTVLVAGDSVFFKNTSFGATAFSWKVNGQTVSTATNFSFSSAAAGVFSICLEAQNGLCVSEKCVVLEFSDPNAACVPTVLRTMGNEILAAGTTALAPDGSVWHIGNQLSIHKILPNGIVEKAWAMTQNIAWAKAERAIFDADGHLVIVGMLSEEPFAMRFDPLTGVIVWFKTLNVVFERAFDILERGSGGPFLISFGQDFPPVPTAGLSGQTKIIELDRATGATNPAFNFQYSASKASHFRRILQVGKDVFAFGSVNDHPNGLVRRGHF